MFTVGADALVEDTLFANNDARFGPGAIDLVAGTVRRSVFLDNRGNGGAISTAQSGQTIEVADSVFDGNVSTTSGGAIKHAAGSHILLRNSLLTSNSAVTGGAISLEDTFAPVTMTIENCTIVGNSSRLSGAIEVNADSTIVLRDSIIRGNVATLLLDDPSASNGIRLPNRVDVTVSIDHTILAEGDVVDPAFRINDSNGYSVGVNGNLDVDPLFVAAAAGDFRLKVSPRSPAIDAGSRTAVAAGVNTLTATANNAPDSGTVDLGYHQPIP